MKILIGLTAGIAVYKAIPVIRALVRNGHSVKVVMTANAAKLVSPLLFQVVSENEVYSQDFDTREPLAHIRLGDWADKMAVLPASANTIAKIAGGIADNLLTSAILACDKPKIIFPAMNVKMFENPVTQANIARLRELRYEVVEPEYGDLACGYRGKGRLPDEDTLIGLIERETDQPLKGKKYIVTAGGTIEKIDPVRFVSNFSSGKMGSELAKALFRKGADILFIYGNVSVKLPGYLNCLKARTTEEMLKAVSDNIGGYDGLFMAAAPADFKPEYSRSKLKKTDDREVYELKMSKNPDILKTVRDNHPDKFLVGFALETDDFIAYAKDKLKDKSLDFIVLNPLSEGFNPLDNDKNTVILIGKDGAIRELKDKPKREVADWLINETLLGSPQ